MHTCIERHVYVHTYVHTKETRVRTTSVTTTLISNSGFLVLSFSHLHFLSFSRSPLTIIGNKWTVQIRIIFFRCNNNKVIKRKTYTHTYTQQRRHLVAPLTHTHSYFWQSSESSLLPRTNIPLFVPFRYTLDVPSFLSISLSLSISLTLFLASLPFPLRCTHSRYTHRKRRDQAKRNE